MSLVEGASKKFRLRKGWIHMSCVGVAFTTTLNALVASAFADDIYKGRTLAQQVCARCHAVDPDAPWNSIGSTPSFMLMARKIDRYQERILSVTARRPHIAQEFDLSAEQLETIAAFVRSLND